MKKSFQIWVTRLIDLIIIFLFHQNNKRKYIDNATNFERVRSSLEAVDVWKSVDVRITLSKKKGYVGVCLDNKVEGIDDDGV